MILKNNLSDGAILKVKIIDDCHAELLCLNKHFEKTASFLKLL